MWSTKLADFVANNGRPEYREPATRVIRELNKFDNPEAQNGIAPLDLGGAIGIGINHQRKTWFLLGAALFLGLLAMMAFTLGPPRLRDPGSNELSAWVLILPMFGGFGLLFILLYLKQPGPEVVVVATPTSLYLVSRHGLRFTPKEALVAWSEERVIIEMNTIHNKGVTTHSIGLLCQPRSGGRKRALMRTRVDEQLFGYWEQFRQAIEDRS